MTFSTAASCCSLAAATPPPSRQAFSPPSGSGRSPVLLAGRDNPTAATQTAKRRVWPHNQERGRVAGRAQAKRRHSWLLPGHATILDCRMVRTGCLSLCFASHRRRRVKNAYCKRMFPLLQMLQRYVVSVLDGYCKSRSRIAYVAMFIHVLPPSL
jgi:hypothetical protein